MHYHSYKIKFLLFYVINSIKGGLLWINFNELIVENLLM